MWFLLVLAIVALVALSIIFIIVVMDLGDFRSNKVNPLEVCSNLNSIVKLVKYLTAAITIIACVFFKSAFPIFFVYLGLTIYFAYKTRTAKFFEPLSIVRECTYKKRQFIIFTAINFIALVYILILCIIIIFE